MAQRVPLLPTPHSQEDTEHHHVDQPGIRTAAVHTQSIFSPPHPLWGFQGRQRVHKHWFCGSKSCTSRDSHWSCYSSPKSHVCQEQEEGGAIFWMTTSHGETNMKQKFTCHKWCWTGKGLDGTDPLPGRSPSFPRAPWKRARQSTNIFLLRNIL